MLGPPPEGSTISFLESSSTEDSISLEQDAVDDVYLELAIDLATVNITEGGGPFGAVIVKDGVIISRGQNRVTLDRDPSAHAEVVAIRQAGRAIANFSLAGATLYSSCEPCPMCMATALWARVKRIVYAADRHAAASGGFDDLAFYELFSTPRGEWGVQVEQRDAATQFRPFAAWLALDERTNY